MPETAYITFPDGGYSPVGGVNSEDNESFIGAQEVQDARNFLFEKQSAFTRPGLSSVAITGMTGLTIKFAASVLCAGTYYTFFYTTTNRLFYVTGSGTAATEIAVAGRTFSNLVTDFRPQAVQGQFVFPNVVGDNTSTLITTAGGVSTPVCNTSAKNAAYGTAMLTRAILGNVPGFSNGQVFTEWSKLTDITTWNTSPSTDGSGNATLIDMPDSIVGLTTLHNILVILRDTGLHLGYNTGIAIPPLRFESWTQKASGYIQPSAHSTYNNVLYGIGSDDVYSFDLMQQQSIGYKIRSALLAQIDSGVIYSAFVNPRVINGQRRLRLFFVPVSGAAAGTPSYVYDIVTQSWSIHSYQKSWNWAFNYMQSKTVQSPAFIDTTSTPTIWYWDGNVVNETAAYFIGPSWRVDPRRDAWVNRVLMSGRDFNQTTAVAVTITGRIGSNSESASDSQSYVGSNSGKWLRKWFNVRQPVGQDFTARVDVPAGVAFATDYIGCEMSEQGGFRG